MSNKSGTSSQVITLPEGGGALSGIGETFSPDLHTGTGNFTVPIALPPGRNGFQPELNLVYSTGAGNSPFGLGWSLSIPGVSRKTSQGIPRYQDNEPNPEEHDTFVLSGAEDLVPVEFETGVTHYQPRTEGLFAKIEHHHENGRDFWRVRSKDGLVSFYGDLLEDPLTDPAIVADPDTRAKIFCWKLVRNEDPFGNHILYDYERDLDTDGIREWDQLYLKRIRYIDYDNNGTTDYLASVEFVYEDRMDAFSSYRAGFEIRTRRRCTQIIVRTHAGQDRIVRRYHLDYLDTRSDLPDLLDRLPANGVSLLSRVRVEGIDEAQPLDAQIEPLPPLEFDYSRFEPEKRTFQPFTAPLDSLPDRSLNDPAYELIDLFGNGLPDVIQMNGTARYWRNLGSGELDLPRPMNAVPAGATLQDTGVQLADFDGDGRTDMMVTNSIGPNGYYSLDFSGAWQGFTLYAQSPSINLEAPDVRLVDLDGDGITDALRTGTSFELFYQDREEGWTDLDLVARGPLEEFPNVNFDDPRVKLGDMSGDDLQDIVLVHNGRIDYWPYMGHGKWGKRITMTNSPIFPDAVLFPPFGFDPARVLIGDVDGDGLADLVYVQTDQITVWINQNGNGWSDPITVNGTPPITNLDAVRVVDMLGVGTAGILWSYDLNTQIGSTYKFLDLTGSVKPYVLNKMDNHMGAVTEVSYASSTEFYLADAEQLETRWQAPLPFPVQVVRRVKVEDHFSGNAVTTEYRYRHGYWDGVEREFRGFGMVEQIDTERFAQPATPDDVEFTPPLLTRTWFHQGAIGLEEGGFEEADYSAEYWPGDAQVLERPDNLTVFLQSNSVPERAKRDAIRSLRGRIIRTELYALDDSTRQDRPYMVTESQFNVREEFAPLQSNDPRQRIFFPTTVAQRTTQWERGDEPMTSFSFTGDFDDFGQPRRQIALAVPRGRDFAVATASAEPYLGTVTTTTFAQRDDVDRYIVDRVASTTAQEILNDGTQALFDLVADVENGIVQLDLFSQSFTYYDGAAFVGLPLGQLGDFGASVRMETLVLTEQILQEAYKSGDSLAMPPEIPPYMVPGVLPNWPAEYPAEFQSIAPLAGYTFADGTDHRARGYFAQTSRSGYDFQPPFQSPIPRGLMKAMRDPLGNETAIDQYDSFDLMPLQVTDAVGLTTIAVYDYRVMQPREVTDPNGNVTRFTFTPLSLLHETFTAGDSQRPSVRLVYDFSAFVNSPPNARQPISVRTIQHEHHDIETDVPLPERDATIERVEFSDGFGRLLQTRSQAEDRLYGDAIFGDDVCPAAQDATQATAAPVVGRQRDPDVDPANVVVSGWQFYDIKGQEVVKFEPFYSTGFDYLAPQAEVADVFGQRVTMVYDPRGQVIRTLDPDGSGQRVIYGRPQDPSQLSLTQADLRSTDVPATFEATPWEAYTYDANDLAPISDGPLSNGTEGPLTNRAPDHHHFTPAHIVIDALGRTVLAMARNRTDSSSPIDEFRTRSTYDIRGNLLTVTDAEDREAFRYIYDLANRPLRTENIDADVRRVILDAVGNEVERRDSKGALILQGYDSLHRPINLWARDDDNSPTVPTLRQVLIYGDSGETGLTSTEIETANLKGALYKHYDEAGLCTFVSYDFKGNLLEKVRRVITDDQILSVFPDSNDPNPDWDIQPFRVDWQPPPNGDLADREDALLENIDYSTTMTYDALNRIKVLQYPEDVDGQRKVLRPRYNRAGALEGVDLDGDTYVEHIAYNARGQRTLLALGNNIMTRYAYEPRTFRLARLCSEHYTKSNDTTYQPSGNALQDFAYEYDLVGNILRITDRTSGSGVLNNPDAMRPDNPPGLGLLLSAGDALIRRFDYDAVYRLTAAEGGREANDLSRLQPWDENPPWQGYNSASHGTPNQDNAPNLTQVYDEFYGYDRVGNMLELRHRSRTNGSSIVSTRNFAIKANTNQIDSLTIGNGVNAPQFVYRYDNNGNMIGEHLARHFEWDHSDQMKAFRNQINDVEPSVHAHCLYDAAGMRVKKLVRRQGGGVETTTYVDQVFEHQRWQRPGESGETNHLHIMDDQQRIALVRVGPAHPEDTGPPIQYHLGDHLGSSNIIVGGDQASDDNFINREEHTPYGETSLGSFGRKRYRFTGKERDEESGLNYHRARYYAAWLGRWVSCDPGGFMDGLNLYTYAQGSPVSKHDLNGQQADTPDENKQSSKKPESETLTYLIIYDKNNDEAKRQAKQAAADHSTEAIAPKHDRISDLIREKQPDVILSFGHGWEDRIRTGENDIYTNELRRELREARIDKRTRLILCHCSAGKKGAMLDKLAADPALDKFVFAGNTSSGSGTRNPDKRFAGSRDNLPQLMEKRLIGTFGLSSKSAKSIRKAVLSNRAERNPAYHKVETSTKGEINIVFRELPVIGFEAFLDMLIENQEIDVGFLGMTSDANERFKAGVELLRSRFQDSLYDHLYKTYSSGALEPSK